MVWFKVDDAFWSHPKVIELSSEAGFLWVRAGSYAAQHLTDGVITVGALRMLGAQRETADELVLAGLWSQVDSRSWMFRDWGDYQPTREQVESERAKEREKKRAQRGRGASRAERGPDGRYVSPGDNPEDTPWESSATRPVPSRPDLTTTHLSESSHQVTAREATDMEIGMAGRAGITDLPRLVAHIEHTTARVVEPAYAVAVANWLLGKAKRWPDNPQRYVLRAISLSPAEVQQQIDEQGWVA